VARSRSTTSNSAKGAINPVPDKDAGSWAAEDGFIVLSMLAAGVGVQHPLVAFCWLRPKFMVSSGSELHVVTRSSFSVPRCGLLQQQRQGPAVDAMLHRYWLVKAELSLRPHLSARQCQGAQVLELPEGLNRLRTVMFRFFGKLQMHRRLN
jgi:hypothetical protein